jgi:hypothetical protein
MYIHCLCAELAIYIVLHGASKILPCPSWGVYQMRVARP